MAETHSPDTISSAIEILDPKPEWPADFAAIASDLQRVLGSLALTVDHIGSTAVPDLPAKDVIDIQVSVKNLADPAILEALISAGYQFVPEITNDNLLGFSGELQELTKLYFRQKAGHRPAHIHIRQQGRLNQDYALLFRDFLTANPDFKAAYASVKTELAARFPNDAPAYYAIKDPYMDTLYRAACLWRSTTDEGHCANQAIG